MVSKTASGQTPVIDFTFTSGTLNPGDTVTFTNTSTGFPTGTNFIWNLGELCYYPSNPDTIYNWNLCNDTIVGVGAGFAHVYLRGRPYLVTLKANDSLGVEYKVEQYVLINAQCNCSGKCNNLVCNGTFEQISFCPNAQPYMGSFANPPGNVINDDASSCWYSVPFTSPDLYINNTCLTTVGWVTNNYIGSSINNCALDHTPSGSPPAYVGVGTINPNGREYFQQELSPLLPGDYDVSFWTRLRTDRGAASNIGLLLTAAPPVWGPGIGILAGTPQISAVSTLNQMITDKNNWTQIAETINLSNSERFLTIGNFDLNDNTVAVGSGIGTIFCPNSPLGFSPFSYYLVDDVLIKKHLELTTTVTPACSGVSNGSIITNVDGTFGPYTFLWSNGSIAQNISNLAAGTYTVTVTDGTPNACTKTFSYVVNAITLPVPQVSSNTLSNCHSGASCTISNFSSYSGCTINWYSTPSGTITTSGGGQFASVSFSGGFTGLGSITVEIICGACTTSTTIYLQACCYDTSLPNPNNIIDQNSSSIGSSLNPAFTYFVNGTFTIDNAFDITNCLNIRMAPGAKIVVSSGNSLTISGSHLFAGCNYMWEGISIENGAVLRVANYSTIEDANSAVKALPGSQYYIDHSEFNKNFIGLNLTGFSPLITSGNIRSNVFQCVNAGVQGFLLPPYAGQLPQPLTVSLAGIYANEIQTLKIESCIFNYLASGIAENNSNLYSIRNTFNHIGIQSALISNYGIYPYNKWSVYAYGGAGNNMCQVIGTYVPSPGSFLATDFVDCYYGIFSRNNYTIINNNSMQCKGGITARGCRNPFTTHIFENGMSVNYFGIRAFNNTASPQVEIDHNFILMANTSASGIGIYAYENNITNNLNIHHNNINCLMANRGISISSTYGAILERNFVKIWPSATNCIAYSLQNCERAVLKYNRSDGPSFLAGNTSTGFVTWASKNFEFECNYATGHNTAFNFNMDCTSPENFKGNLMESYVTGLYIDNAGIMDVQNDRGNLWCGGGTMDAECNSSNTNPANSNFSGDNTTGYNGCDYQPMPNPNFNYFSPTGIAQFECSESYPLTPPSPDDMSNIDWAIAQDSTVTSDSTDAVEWLLQQSLYDKYLNDSTLAINTLVQQFINDMQLTNVPAFVAVKKQMVAIREQSQMVDSLIAIAGVTNQFNLSLLNHLTDSINSGAISVTDSILFVNQIDSLRNQLAALAVYSDSLQVISQALAENESEQILIQNAAIQAVKIYEQNEQRLNEIKLETITRDNYDFTTQHIQDIFDIANQCPVFGGTAVLDAQGIYNYIYPGYVFDNKTICQQVYAMRQMQLQKDSTKIYNINVFPNPTKDLINVGYDLPKNQIATINIYNNYGSIIRSQQIVGSGNYAEIKISVANLSSGLYAYLIVAGVNINHSSGKVLVIK